MLDDTREVLNASAEKVKAEMHEVRLHKHELEDQVAALDRRMEIMEGVYRDLQELVIGHDAEKREKIRQKNLMSLGQHEVVLPPPNPFDEVGSLDADIVEDGIPPYV